MSEQEELHPIRCAGCRRTVAYSTNPLTLRHKIYCDKICAQRAPATADYLRNVEWLALNDAGMAPLAIGRLYGSAHSLVYKTLRKMREPA